MKRGRKEQDKITVPRGWWIRLISFCNKKWKHESSGPFDIYSFTGISRRTFSTARKKNRKQFTASTFAALVEAVGCQTPDELLTVLQGESGSKASKRIQPKLTHEKSDNKPTNLGWKAAEIKSSINVLDLNGNAIACRVFKGILPNSNTVVDHIPGQIIMLTPGARIVSGPRLVDLWGHTKGLDFALTPHGDAICSYRVVIANGLTSDDPPLNFAIETHFERAVLMTSEEVRAAYAKDAFQWDYFSYDVVVPTDLLTLEVSFPAKTKIQYFPNVFFAWSELVCSPELRRIRRGFGRTSNGARFIIRNPRIGFRYLIYWTFHEGT